MRSLYLLIFLVLLLAACNPDMSSQDTSTQITSSARWDRNPSQIVFRSDITGGSSDEFLTRSDVPYCTVYGDNHVVWTNSVGPFNVQVLHDIVSDEAMNLFLDYLVRTEKLQNYDARAALQVPRESSPVVEVMQLNADQHTHETDAFAGWDFAYFQRILDHCRSISTSPVLFEPTGGWISARAVDDSYNDPSVLWNAEVSGLSLAELAASGEPAWLENRNTPILWNILRTSPPGVHLVEDGQHYQIAIEIPNITRTSPPAPGT
jgi:hypothetical protein